MTTTVRVLGALLAGIIIISNRIADKQIDNFGHSVARADAMAANADYAKGIEYPRFDEFFSTEWIT